MPWKRVSKEHWANDSDKHVFYDAEAKLLCTEAYPTEPGLSMVVIPKDVLEKLLKENRYYLFPEAEFEALKSLVNRHIEEATGNTQDLLRLEESLHKSEQKSSSLEQLVSDAEKRLETVLQIVEIDGHRLLELTSEISKLKAGLRAAEQNKLKIIEVANKEINGLREEVKQLKDKYGETNNKA